MASSLKDQQTQVQQGQQGQHQRYSLQEFLRAEPTVSERLSGFVPSKKGERSHDGKAEEAIRKFESAWNNAGK
ncbi:hypothetical protein F5Y11DRAFT_363861 [Daldinia sp. FL1419]|nr:hypothetical protein F5Y11DRAFT_363861 [Daldinia sp. FL1419]